MKKLVMTCILIFFATTVWASDAAVSDLEDLSLAPDSYWNGELQEGETEVEGSFTSGIATYNNLRGHDEVWNFDYWAGFAYSNLKDTQTSGFSGQFMAIPGSGATSSDNYAVAYCSTLSNFTPTITLSEPMTLSGAYFTNTNYAYYSMLEGDAFAKKFEQGDWFKLTITGKDEQGIETGTVDFYLAYGTDLVNEWIWKDLSILDEVKTLEFSLSSTDTGAYGMNTPAYFAMDSLEPESEDDNSYLIQSKDIDCKPLLWNMTGSYLGELLGCELTFNLSQDAKGKLSGNAHVTGEGYLEAHRVEMDCDLDIKGSIKQKPGYSEVTITAKISGTADVPDKGISDAKMSGTKKITATIDPTSLTLIGKVQDKVSIKGFASLSEPGDFSSALPEDMDGTWSLEIKVNDQDKKMVESCLLWLSNGDILPFSAQGKYKAKTDETRFTLKGTEEAKGCKLSPVIKESTGEVVSITGKVLGQTIKCNK